MAENLCITTSKGRMASEPYTIIFMSTSDVPQLSITTVKRNAITLYFQPCSAHYTALQAKIVLYRNTFSITPVATENTDDFHYKHHISRD